MALEATSRLDGIIIFCTWQGTTLFALNGSVMVLTHPVKSPAEMIEYTKRDKVKFFFIIIGLINKKENKGRILGGLRKDIDLTEVIWR